MPNSSSPAETEAEAPQLQHGSAQAPARRSPSRRAALAACVTATAVLLLLLRPGVLRYPDRAAALRAAAELQRLRLSNSSLAAQLTVLREAADDPVCRIDGALIDVPDPSFPTAPPARMEYLVRPPEQVSVAAVPNSDGPNGKPKLADLLTVATVQVVAIAPDGSVNEGSGFFVNDHIVVTQRRVIAHAEASKILVANHALGGFQHAEPVASPRGGGDPADDLALLELAPGPNRISLQVGPTPRRLTSVYSAGFPRSAADAVIDTDNKTIEDAARAPQGAPRLPQIDLHYGRIEALIESGTRGLAVLHDLPLPRGNIGGPLVDACGRLVAIDSGDPDDADAPTRVAPGAAALRRFLERRNIPFTSDDSLCAPPPSQPIPQSPGQDER